MIDFDEYTLTKRTIVIAAGVSHMTVQYWLEGIELPTDSELRDLCGAFILNKYSRILVRPRNQLMTIFKDIIAHDRKMRGRHG